MLCPSNSSSSNEVIEEEPKPKENLTRKEKKAKYGYPSLSRKLDKFEVARTDKKILRYRNPKKCSKKGDRYNYPLTFAKSEAIFNKWLIENKHRLKYQLIPNKYNNYHFQGVIKEVELLIHNSPEAEIAFSYYGDILCENGRCLDLASIDYIGQEAYHPQKGYFDMDRVDGVYTYFPTREELYVNEVFEKIINYSNEKLIPENSLYMFDSNGFSWAYIENSDESNPKNRRTTRELKAEKLVDDLSQEEYNKLLEEEKVYRVFKYDLFDSTKEPEVRYFWKNR